MSPDDENIIELMGPRKVIGQPIGLLMTEHDVEPDTAVDMLVQTSSDSGQGVRTAAVEIVTQSLRSE